MSPRGPDERGATIRQSLHEALVHGDATARDLSRKVGIPEGDVAGHLEHLARSLRAHGERLRVEGPSCLECGFDFPRRRRLTRPAHCPRCRSRRISLPRFGIEEARRG